MHNSKLHEVLSIQSVSYNQTLMLEYIIKEVSEIPNADFFLDGENIYIIKGNAHDYPCIVAHMDTVHDIVEDLYPVDVDGNITGFNRKTMEQTGIGGDDKVGVYIALQCLRKFDNIKVAFFHDEEVGCIGSYNADLSFFGDCRFVLQCDRRGNSDFVTEASGTSLSSSKFQKAIKKIMRNYGYKFANGMMTDVMALKQSGLGVSCANISCGYYNPHSFDEYVNVADVENCLQFVFQIISSLQSVYVHLYQKPVWYGAYHSKYPQRLPATQTKIHYEVPQDNWFGYSDEYISQKTQKPVDNYCKDCWCSPVQPSGYCKHCEAWYLEKDVKM